MNFDDFGLDDFDSDDFGNDDPEIEGFGEKVQERFSVPDRVQRGY